jgi:hypothetical protein
MDGGEKIKIKEGKKTGDSIHINNSNEPVLQSFFNCPTSQWTT